VPKKNSKKLEVLDVEYLGAKKNYKTIRSAQRGILRFQKKITKQLEVLNVEYLGAKKSSKTIRSAQQATSATQQRQERTTLPSCRQQKQLAQHNNERRCLVDNNQRNTIK
jgi:hypothetical protein